MPRWRPSSQAARAVRAVRIAGRRYIARQSTRSHAELVWEMEFLLHLAGCGFRVPRPLPAKDGRMEVEGLVVLEWLDGDPPRTMRDWEQAAAVLERMHEATRIWPQRPGFASTADLLRGDAGGDIDLAAMPADVVALVRAAWRPLAGLPLSVVHGDPHAGNIRISSEGIGLIDWDEARVDVSLLDLADMPHLDAVKTAIPLHMLRAAADAWETASGWVREPEYARRRLETLRSRLQRP